MPFPTPLLLPNDVEASRLQNHKLVLRAVKSGIFFRCFVILFELFGVLLINSYALYVDAISSLVDVMTSLFLILCMKMAQRPPDYDHPFGHGRYESMGGFLLGMLLVVVGGIMLFQQIMGFLHVETERIISPWAWLFSAVAMVVLEMAYRMMIKIAKEASSPALAADAYHYRIDSLTSLLATITLVLAALSPEWSAFTDSLGAIAIALFMIGLGFFGSRENFHQLMDKIPEPRLFDCVKAAAVKTPGVEATEKIRIQRYGPDAHVDIDIEVKPDLTVDSAHKISQQVRLEIQKAWPAVRDVTVHIEPYYANDH